MANGEISEKYDFKKWMSMVIKNIKELVLQILMKLWNHPMHMYWQILCLPGYIMVFNEIYSDSSSSYVWYFNKQTYTRRCLVDAYFQKCLLDFIVW